MNTFEIRDLKEAKFYLRIELKYTTEGIYFYQWHYI